MRRERSQQIADPESRSDTGPSVSGILYVVGVPIGHPEDITLRALHVLRDVDLIASEDPSATRLLLKHHGIDTLLTSYGPRHLREKVAVLLHRLTRGARIAIVSDCGSPVISDPGSLLIASAHSCGISVASVPGPSALTAALAASGLSGDAFVFQGWLPETKSALTHGLRRLLKHSAMTVVFSSVRSLHLALDHIAETAPRRTLVLACDLTHPEERIVRGTARRVRSMADRWTSAQSVTMIIVGSRGRGAGG